MRAARPPCDVVAGDLFASSDFLDPEIDRFACARSGHKVVVVVARGTVVGLGARRLFPEGAVKPPLFTPG